MGGSTNPITLTNSIVVNNTATDPSQMQVGYKPRNGGGNIEFPSSNNERRVVQGSRMVDPRLGSLQTINGVLLSPLLPGSPAINTGVRAANVPTTDQRGYRRDGKIDVGAFEIGATALTRTANAVHRTTHAKIAKLANPRPLQNQLASTNSDLLTGIQPAGAIVGTPATRAIVPKPTPAGMPNLSSVGQMGFGLVESTHFPLSTGSGNQQFSIAASHPLQTTHSTQSLVSLSTAHASLATA